MKNKSESANNQPKEKFEDINLEECLDCVCYEFRKTARQIINYYDAALKETDLKSNQFIILAAVAYMGKTNFKNLAEFVGIDQSTLARNLVTVEKQGFVTVNSGMNKREKIISLSRKGKNKLASAFPYWQKAQREIVHHLGSDEWKEMKGDLSRMVSITKELN